MLMHPVTKGEVGVGRSGIHPRVLLQVIDGDRNGEASSWARISLTEEETRELIEDLEEELKAVAANPQGLLGSEAEKLAERQARGWDDG